MVDIQNMGWAILADAVLLLHGAFIAWATLGALAVWRWPRLVWAHLPALAWGGWVEASAGVCPLTPAAQWRIALGLAAFNLLLYGLIVWRRRRARGID